jgi:hypothetical protein
MIIVAVGRLGCVSKSGQLGWLGWDEMRTKQMCFLFPLARAVVVFVVLLRSTELGRDIYNSKFLVVTRSGPGQQQKCRYAAPVVVFFVPCRVVSCHGNE